MEGLVNMATRLILQKHNRCQCFARRCPESRPFFLDPGLLCMCQRHQILTVVLCYLADVDSVLEFLGAFQTRLRAKTITALVLNGSHAHGAFNRTHIDPVKRIPLIGIADHLTYAAFLFPKRNPLANNDINKIMVAMQQAGIVVDTVDSVRQAWQQAKYFVKTGKTSDWSE